MTSKPALTPAQWRRVKKHLQLTEKEMWECFKKAVVIRVNVPIK